jgi:hypothetical protein
MAGTGAGADATAKLKKEYGSARAVFGLRATNDAIVASGHLIGAGDSGGVHPTPAALLTGLPNDTVAGVYVSGAATTVDHAFQQLSAQPWFGQLKGSLSGVTQQYGLKIPADLETLLGNQTVFALGNVAAGADFPEFGLIGHSNDPASAADVAKRLSTLGDQLSDGRLRLASERHGENVVLATNDYATKLGAGGHLGDTAGFKSAVGSLTDPVYFAAYVDVKQFTVAMHDTPAAAKPISKIGMSVTGNASDVAFQVRVVIG